MIEFHYETNFKLEQESAYVNWLNKLVSSEEGRIEHLSFIFCDDDYLLEINQKYLGHDTYTDIVTFSYVEGGALYGDVYISIDRMKENSVIYNSNQQDELLRVMAHGTLHLLGYNDKSEQESFVMRSKEEEKVKLFHVEPH